MLAEILRKRPGAHGKLLAFANARSIRNALDRARLRQANRLFASHGKALTRKDLVTIEAADILAGRVFAKPADQ